MKDSTIRNIIKRLNTGKTKNLIHLKHLSDKVSVGYVWEKLPTVKDNIAFGDGPYRFFFIKENGQYIGAVLDMSSDLHWFMLKEFRSKGHLSKPLRETILPYLFFQDPEKDFQRITISRGAIGDKNYESSNNLAVAVGFEPVKQDEYNSEYKISREKIKDVDFSDVINPISEQRLKDLQKQIHCAYKLLWMAQTELDMAYDDSDMIDDLKKRVYKMIYKAEDIWFEYKNSNVNA